VHEKKLNRTNIELNGVVYIQVIYHLGIDIVNLRNKIFLKSVEKDIKGLEGDICNDIDAIFLIQDAFAEFKSESFNKQLEHIKKFKNTNVEFYEFLDVINHENYR